MPDEEWLIGMLALAQGTSLLGADDKIPSRPLLEVRLNAPAETFVLMAGCIPTLVPGAVRCLTAELTGLNVAAHSVGKGDCVDENLAGEVHVEVRGRTKG
jgi:hypothetical protein